MKSKKFESIGYNRRIITTLSLLAVATMVFIEFQDSKDNRISIGEVTCVGAEPFQLEKGTEISEIAGKLASSIEQKLTESQEQNLKSIVIKKIVSQEGEVILTEQQTDNNSTELALNSTVNISLPNNCRVYNYPF